MGFFFEFIAKGQSGEFASRVFAEPSDFGIVEQAGPEFIGRLCEVDGEPRIVKLTILVDYCALEMSRLERGMRLRVSSLEIKLEEPSPSLPAIQS